MKTKTQEILKKPKRAHPHFKPLIREICLQYRITEREFNSSRKYRDRVYARFHYWNILYYHYKMSYAQIGRECGVCHGTVMNGLEQIASYYPVEREAFRERQTAIMAAITTAAETVTRP